MKYCVLITPLYLIEELQPAPANLVYGIGKHKCLGRLLASWQLRIALQTLLLSVQGITLAPGELPERETAPVGGYHRVPIILT